MLSRRLLAGPKIAFVIGVHPIGNRRKTVRRAEFLKDGKELIFAVKAPHGVIARVGGIFQFTGLDDLHRNLLFAGKRERIFKVRAREARRIRDYRPHAISERLMRGPRQKGGVDASRVGNDQSGVRRQDLTQKHGLLVEIWDQLHSLHFS